MGRYWGLVAYRGGVARAGVQTDGGGDVAPEELVLALRDVGRALVTFLAFQARANDLGVSDLIVLAGAADGDGVVPGEAGRALGLRSSTMAMLSGRLEQGGLIARVAHPTDRRLVLLVATARGRRLLDRLPGSMLAAVTELVAGADPQQRRFLQGFLAQLTELIESQSAPSPARRPRRRSTAAGA